MKTIKEIQSKLKQLGYSLNIDGVNGPKTKAVIQEFQKKNGLITDGIVGPKTEAKLFPTVISTPQSGNSTSVTTIRDKASISVVEKLHPRIRDRVKSLIIKAEAKFPINTAIRIVQGGRTYEQQHALYCQPWDKKDNDGDGKIDEADEKVTNADAGQSFHNFFLAVDFAILYDINEDGKYEKLSWDMLKDFDRDGQADWMEVVNTFKTDPDCAWGGDWKSFKDNPHFEWKFGHTIKQLREKYEAKKVDSQGYIIL